MALAARKWASSSDQLLLECEAWSDLLGLRERDESARFGCRVLGDCGVSVVLRRGVAAFLSLSRLAGTWPMGPLGRWDLALRVRRWLCERVGSGAFRRAGETFLSLLELVVEGASFASRLGSAVVETSGAAALVALMASARFAIICWTLRIKELLSSLISSISLRLGAARFPALEEDTRVLGCTEDR